MLAKDASWRGGEGNKQRWSESRKLGMQLELLQQKMAAKNGCDVPLMVAAAEMDKHQKGMNPPKGMSMNMYLKAGFPLPEEWA